MCAALSLRRQEGYAEPPTGIDLCITDACNLSCSYCPLWGEKGLKPTPRFMDLGQGQDLLRQLAGFQPSLRIICGESLLHPEWHRFVSRARSLKMWSSLVTNGTLLAEHAETMVRSGLLAVGVSVDGVGAVNDGNRGAGSYARIRNGLSTLQRAKDRADSDLPWVEIYTTIQDSNHRQLVRFAEKLAEWGIRKYRLQHLIWCSSRQFHVARKLLREVDPTWDFGGDDHCYVRDEPSGVDPIVLGEQLRELESRSWPFEIEVVPSLGPMDLESYYSNPDYQRRDHGSCPMLDSYTYVGPHGNLRPCIHLSMGNVFERPFLEVWNGEPYRKFRRHISHHGRLPTCQRCPC